MRAKNESLEARVDGYTRLCLTAIAVLLTVLVIGLWADGPWSPDPAAGAKAFVSAGQQRKAILDAQQATNRKLDTLIGLFREGKAQVKLAEGKAPAPAPAGNGNGTPGPNK